MSDLISRQAAIDELKKISFSHWFECGEYLSEDTREIKIISSSKALEAIEALPSAEPEPQWIPCSSAERPKDREEVMVTIDDGYKRYTDTDEYVDGKFWYHDENNVVAWKPFDEPWEGEEP